MPKGWISSVDAVYLQKWKLDKKCILFRISNQIFQANFLDGSQIFIKSNSPIACFKSNEDEIVVENMATEKNLSLSHPSFSRRIKYVRNLLLETMRNTCFKSGTNSNSGKTELDPDYEEDDYLYKGGLKGEGRKNKLEREEKEKVVLKLVSFNIIDS